MVRIDQDLEVVVQVLAHIAPQLGCHNFSRLGIVAMNPKIDGVPRVDNSNFGLLSRSLTLIWLLLAKFHHRLGGLPHRIVQSAVKPWRMLDTDGLRRGGHL